MKTLLLLASLLPLAATYAQTPASSAKAAEKRTEDYTGPRVVDNSQALGRKMIQQSRPTDALITSSKELGHKMIQRSKPADGLPKQRKPQPTQPR